MIQSLRSRTFAVPSFLILLFGIVGTVAVFATVTAWDNQRNELEFVGLADNQIAAIERETAASTNLVTFVGDFITLTGVPPRAAFSSFAKLEIARYDSVQALEWVPVVTQDQRPAFEAAARQDGLQDFSFREIDEDSQLRPAGVRERYFPVYYVEPLEGNEAALGLDLGANTERFAALTSAVETASAVATEPIILVQETGQNVGFLVVTPVFSGAAVRGTPELSWADVQGFAIGVFRAPDVISRALVEGYRDQIDTIVEDVTGSGASFSLYESVLIEGQSVPYSRVDVIQVAGREWRITATPSQAFLDARDSTWRWVFLVGALGLVLIAFVSYARFQSAEVRRQAALAESLQGTTERLETTLGIAETLARPGEPQEIFQQALARMSDGFDVQHFGLRIVTNEGQLQLVAYHGEQQKRPIGYIETDPESAVMRAHASGKPIIDNDHAPGRRSGMRPGVGDRSVLTLPLVASEGTVGSLYVGATKPGAFSPEKVRALDATAQLLAPFVRDVQRRSEVDQIKTELLSIASHELRTPLTAIRSSLGLVQAGVFGSLDERGTRAIDIAAEASARMVSLVSDMLDLEKIRANKYTVEIGPHSIGPLLESAAASWQQAAEEAGLILVLGGTEGEALCDETAVGQVLANLISNAIKFSPPGGSVTLSAHRDDREVIVTVKDQGRGIPRDKLAEVFDRFSQVDSSDSREKGGSGLGLAICSELTTLMGGRIWIESEEGLGTTVSFALPAARQPAGALNQS